MPEIELLAKKIFRQNTKLAPSVQKEIQSLFFNMRWHRDVDKIPFRSGSWARLMCWNDNRYTDRKLKKNN